MATATGDKAPGEFKTIGELSRELGVAQHILRYWETKFPQLRPLQRAGNRRYYRPDDVALAKRIHKLLEQDGYTIRGVQQLLSRGGARRAEAAVAATGPTPANQGEGPSADALRALRDRLARALEASAA